MENTVLKVEGVSKQYRLGQIGTSTLADDLKRFIYKLRGKEDPFRHVGEENIRDKAGGDYIWALRDINIDVKQGEVLGIIGKNGAGKSTLLKVLSQVTSPTEGRVMYKGRIASLLEVGTGFHPELTGRENIYLNGAILGMNKVEINRKLDEIVEFSGVAKYIDTPVKRYSSGMKVRLGFAVAAHLEPEILIVDEVLAVGDAEFQKRCLGKMKDVASHGRTVLFVSHNMGSISELCNRAILLMNGKIVNNGEPNAVISSYLSKQRSKRNPLFVKDKKNEYFALRKIAVTDVNEKPRFAFDLKDRIVISVELEVFTPLERVFVNLTCKKSHTILFVSRLSDDNPEWIAMNKGNHKLKFEIDEKSIIAGEYYVSISVAYKGGKATERKRLALDDIMSFEVEELSVDTSEKGYAAKRGGMIVAPGSWTRQKNE